VLAADACTDLGLSVHHPDGETRDRLHALIPDGGSVSGPVDTVATVSADGFRQALEILAADSGVHAIIALVLRTGATGDLLSAIEEADLGVPLAVVVLNQPEAVRTLGTRRGKVPAYAYPEAAARALARAARYAEWRGTPSPPPPELGGVDAERARELVHGFLAARPAGDWLPRPEAIALLGCYGLSLAPAAEAGQGDDVVAIGVTDDQMFGPLVMLSPAVAVTSPPAGAARLAPLTSADADVLINSVRSRPSAPGQPAAAARHRAAADAALRDALLRVSRLTDDLPEVAELDLSPVVVGPQGAVIADARVRVAPQQPQDPFLRKLL
jgi:acyl-CoA synthetase (NDP forming)